MEEEHSIGYKIRADFRYRVFRKDLNGKTYYNIRISQSNYDGTTTEWYRPVNFKKGVEVPNCTDIIIYKGFENLRPNPKDKYNPITSIMITEFETVENKQLEVKQALEDYQQNLKENEMEELPY